MGHAHENQDKRSYAISDFYPLIVIFTLIIFITLASQYYQGWNLKSAMRIFMGSFFLIFGLFKIINLRGFAQAYSMYDLLAKKYFAYGYVYPFLEVALGFSYLYNWYSTATNVVTFVLMVVNAAGVFNELRKGHQIICGCLGSVFKIPMTYVTLTEDLLMAFMALVMLLM